MEKYPNRVVHVIEASATGTLAMTSTLANHQNRIGCEVLVIFSKRPETPENITRFFDEGIHVSNIQMVSPLDRLSAIWMIRSKVIKSSCDAVFLHSSMAGFIGRVALHFTNAKVFYIPHCISFLRSDVSWFARKSTIFLERIAGLKRSTIIACSRSEARAIKAVLSPRFITVIENGVDSSQWPYGRVWSSRSILLCNVGQIRAQKDPLAFSRIVASVRLRYPEMRYVWIGDGLDTFYKSALQDAGVEILGWCDKCAISEILSDTKFFVSTSLWEGLPVAPIEAMLSGCISLLSTCNGNTDVLENCPADLSFSREADVERLIELYLADQALAETTSRDLREYAQVRFSGQEYFRKMDRVLACE